MASRSFIDYLLNPGPDEADLQAAIREAAGVADDIAAAFVLIDAAVAATAADVVTVAAQESYIDGVVAEFTTDATAALAALAADRASALAAIDAASDTATTDIASAASAAITTVNAARNEAVDAADAAVATVSTAVSDGLDALIAQGDTIQTDMLVLKADTQAARDEAVAAAASVNIPLVVAGDGLKFLQVKADESGSEWVDILPFDGDIGAGGTEGLVPAPAAGDAAANKFLKADGTWQTAGDVSFVQVMGFYSALALEQAEDRATGPIAAGPDGNGIFDGFNVLTYVDVAGATNLDTGTAGKLKPGSSTAVIGNTATPAAGTVNFVGTTVVDRTFTLTPSRTVTKISLYSTAAVSAVLKIVKRNSAGNYDVVYSQALTHPGSGWADMTLTVPYATPGTGTYHVAFYYAASQTIQTWTAAGNRAAFTGNAAGSGVTFSETSGAIAAMKVEEAVLANMTVRGVGYALSVAPDWTRMMAFVELNGAVLGTDLFFDVTRDGANWQTVPMTQVYVRPGGSVLIDSGIVALTAASGTIGRWRIRTANNKPPAVNAVGFQMGVN